MYYAGIGSRKTPDDILILMGEIAHELSKKGLTLRSGGAQGADQAFQIRAERAEIYLPWAKFEKEFQDKYGHEKIVVPSSDKQAETSVNYFHPAGEKLSFGARAMMRRNYRQVIGRSGYPNSSFVLCWTEGGKDVGGTAQAIRIARANKIPVINLGCEEQRDAVIALIRENVKVEGGKE